VRHITYLRIPAFRKRLSISVSLTVTLLFATVLLPISGSGQTFTLNVTERGIGTVTSTDGNINCGNACSFNYSSGTVVTLNAAAASGWSFLGWGGNCSGTGSCVVTMTQAQTVYATFSTNCPTEPAQDVPIGSGQTFIGSNCALNTTGDVDSFQFTGTVGDTWRMVLAFTSGGYPSNMCMKLFDPNSSQLFSGCTNTYYGVVSVANTQKLTAAGLYTVVVTEPQNAAIKYALSLDRLNPAPPDGAPLILSQNITGNVNPQTSQQIFTFLGATTGQYQITSSFASGGYPNNLCFDVYQPDGTNVVSAACTNTYYGVVSISKVVAPVQNGTYVVVIYAAGNDALINFNLQISCYLGNCSAGAPLTVGDAGSGTGTITSSDGFINCGSACSHIYPIGTSVTLTATPAAGSVFTGWSGGGCSGTGSCVVDMTQAQNVTATFTPVYLLAVSKAGSGTVTSTDGNINCGSACSYTYLSGTSVTLTATPASGWAFTGWSGACTGTGTCMVNMTQNQSVSATFVQVFQLTVSVTGIGTVTSTDGNIICPGVCSYSYLSGTKVTLNANPSSGWAFTGWSGACTGTGACMVTMTQAQSVSATFVQLFQLTVSVTGSGTVTSSDGNINCSTSCSHNYPSGTSITLTATPVSGWSLASGGWTGCSSTAGSTCTVLISGSNASVTAKFVQNTYPLTVGVTGSGTVTSTDGNINCPTACSFNYLSGTSVTLNANPASGWSLYGWTGCDLVNGNSCSLTMNSARGVSAIFVQTTYSLSVFPIGTGNGTITSSDKNISCGSVCSSIYAIGASVTLAANPGFDATFVGWTGCDTTSGNTCTVAMNSARSVTASFTSGFGGLRFVPVTPCRVADTRNADGLFGGPPIAGGSSRDFPVPLSSCGIPPDAQAYALNISVVPHGFLGHLTVWPTGLTMPSIALLNSHDGRIKNNAAIVGAGLDGSVSAYVTDTTDLIIDVNGYFVSDTTQLQFYPITPCRVLDTRNATGPLGGPELVAGQERDFPILSSSCNIPPTAQGYSLNFSVVPDVKLGHLTAWPTGQPQPNVSNLNDPTGTVTANAGIVQAGTNGSISTYVTDQTHLIVDINGYFAPPSSGGLSLYLAYPCRLYDTRSGPGPFQGERAINAVGVPCAIPANVQAVVLNATVLPQGFFGHLTLWPDGETQPTVSTLNARDGAFTSNMAIVPVLDGLIDAYMTNTADLIFDISAYFAP